MGMSRSDMQQQIKGTKMKCNKDKAKGYKDGGAVWDKKRPSNLEKSEKLTPTQKATAKMKAKKAGRPYPNLVDNMNAAKKKSK